MGNCTSNITKKELSDVEQELHDLEFVNAVKKGCYEKVYIEGGLGAKLNQHIDGIPILHYVILKGLSELDRIMDYDGVLAYLTCYSDQYNKKGIFDLSIVINSHDQFHFSEGVDEFGESNQCADFKEVSHTPAEFCLYLKHLFDSDDYHTTAWDFSDSNITKYVVKTLEDWYNYFKSIEKNPNRSLCVFSTYANVSSDTDMIRNNFHEPSNIKEDTLREANYEDPIPSELPIPTAPPVPPTSLRVKDFIY